AVDRAQLAEPGGEVLLKPHRKQRPHAEIDNAELRTGVLDGVIDAALIGRRQPDLVAKIARIGEAVYHAGRARDIHLAEVHEAEGLLRDVGVGQLFKHGAGFRPGDGKADQRLVEAVYV